MTVYLYLLARFPLRAEFYGFQLEIDTVYNVASPVVNAIVLRVNYYASKKINLVELAVDIDGKYKSSCTL